MSIKVHSGTPNHGENLCDTCTHCTHITGQAASQEIRLCTANKEFELTFAVARCTDHLKRTEKSLRAMEDMAWIIRTNPSGKAIGFMSAKEWREKNPYEDVVPSGRQ